MARKAGLLSKMYGEFEIHAMSRRTVAHLGSIRQSCDKYTLLAPPTPHTPAGRQAKNKQYVAIGVIILVVTIKLSGIRKKISVTLYYQMKTRNIRIMNPERKESIELSRRECNVRGMKVGARR